MEGIKILMHLIRFISRVASSISATAIFRLVRLVRFEVVIISSLFFGIICFYSYATLLIFIPLLFLIHIIKWDKINILILIFLVNKIPAPLPPRSLLVNGYCPKYANPAC